MNNTNMRHSAEPIYDVKSLKTGDFVCDQCGTVWMVEENRHGTPIVSSYKELTQRGAAGWSLMVPVTTAAREEIDQAPRDKDAYRAENAERIHPPSMQPESKEGRSGGLDGASC